MAASSSVENRKYLHRTCRTVCSGPDHDYLPKGDPLGLEALETSSRRVDDREPRQLRQARPDEVVDVASVDVVGR
jgi:hypothetical protein